MSVLDKCKWRHWLGSSSCQGATRCIARTRQSCI